MKLHILVKDTRDSCSTCHLTTHSLLPARCCALRRVIQVCQASRLPLSVASLPPFHLLVRGRDSPHFTSPRLKILLAISVVLLDARRWDTHSYCVLLDADRACVSEVTMPGLVRAVFNPAGEVVGVNGTGIVTTGKLYRA